MIRNDETYYVNRIALLKSRDRDNGNIVKKCERCLRKLRAANN